MSLYQWVINKQTKKIRDIEFKLVEDKAKKLIKHDKTQKTDISHFPNVYNYIKNKFQKVELLSVDIYICDPEALKQVDWSGIGGCYIHCLNSIFVKSEIRLGEESLNNDWTKILFKYSCGQVDMEDVLVHEMMHFVSAVYNRSGRKHLHMEEEFVYTNCVDFYKQKKMTDEDIIVKNFLPFLLQDIYRNHALMSQICTESGIIGVFFNDMTNEQYNEFLNVYGCKIIDSMLYYAKQEGFKMLKSYKDGHYTVCDFSDTDAKSRFSCLDIR